MIDIHSHVIPKVDDGCNDYETGIDTLISAYQEGIDTVILTPHLFSYKYVNDIAVLKEEFDRFTAEVNRHVPIRFYLGNEIAMDHGLLELVNKNKALTLAGSKYVLVEVPLRERIYQDWYDEELASLKNGGYQVIIAHPERYTFAGLDDIVDRWVNNGYLLQCNQDSLFSETSYLALKLIKENKISFLASDSHIRLHRPVSFKQAYKSIELRFGKDMAARLCIDNPAKVINNLDF